MGRNTRRGDPGNPLAVVGGGARGGREPGQES
jgi:hypothetical protein